MVRWAATNIRSDLISVVVWEEGTSRCIRMFTNASLDSKNLFRQRFRDMWPDHYIPPVWNIFSVNVAHMAQNLPGVQMVVTCPVTGVTRRLFDIIIDLNDNRGWSREKIADWIETLDNVPKFEVK